MKDWKGEKTWKTGPVDRTYLFAQHKEVHLLILDQFRQDLWYVEWLQVFVLLPWDLHVHTTVSPHGQSRPQGLLALGWSARHSDDLTGDLLLLQPHSLLHSDLIEGVHAVLHPLRHHAWLVRLHSHLAKKINPISACFLCWLCNCWEVSNWTSIDGGTKDHASSWWMNIQRSCHGYALADPECPQT